MNNYFTGREKELSVLSDAFRSPQSEMIAITGRRRVGKTHLVKYAFSDKFDFYITGLQDSPNKLQLENFAGKLSEYSNAGFPIGGIKNWLEAFNLLTKHLSSKKQTSKKILFFDELPWMSNPKSGCLEALGHFWNDWASTNNVLLIICGSAASWMIKHVVHQKGSLHNRLTRLVKLQPFTLAETYSFLHAKKIDLSPYAVLQLYMVMGGIPHYLKEIRKGESVSQNIDRICFNKSGLLYDEFDKLYKSLYDHPENHIAIIKALASKWMGLARADLVNSTGISDGGGFTRILSELEQSDFITIIEPFDKKKKDALHRLTDSYSLFYLKFMASRRKNGEGSFANLEQTTSWKSWCGYAFETICFTHIQQIKKALGIAGVYAEISSFLLKGTKSVKGAQVDLLIDRADNIINICEIKFYGNSFIITKKYADELITKRRAVKQAAPAKKSVFITLITCFGVEQNSYSLDHVQSEIIATQSFFQY